MSKIQWYEKRQAGPAGLAGGAGGVDVIGWYRVETGVLKGQMCKKYIETFDTEEEAEEKYGEMNWYSKYLAPEPSLAHLPGPEDPVPGGMYPDDWNDGY